MNTNKDSFCYVPFRELYFEEANGAIIRSCCIQQHADIKTGTNVFNKENPGDWFSNLDELVQIRKQFLENKKPVECKRCWIYEEKNIQSYRNKWNKKYKDTKKDLVQLEVIDLRLSNKCNLQCKMCSPEFSDQIAKNILSAQKNNGYVPRDYISNNIYENGNLEINANRKYQAKMFDDLLEFIKKTPTIKQLKFAGGEPFVMEDFENFIVSLAENDIVDLNIFLLSNCTSVKNRLLKSLKKFKKVEISCSIDGTGKWLEYQRFPAKWTKIKQNYNKLLNAGIFATLTPCWSHLNVESMPEFLQWALDETKCPWIAYNEVTWPSYLSFELMPLNFRKPIIDKLEKIDFAKYKGRIDNNYIQFIENFKIKERKITETEKDSLRNHIKLWNHNNTVTFEEFCPFSDILLT